MNASIRRKLSMARRALDFAVAHPVADPSFAIVIKRLDDEVSRTDALAVQQRDGLIGSRAATARRVTLRDAIRSEQLRRLKHIAELAAKDQPALAGQFPLPPVKAPYQVFLVAAKSMLAAAVPHKDLFVSLGLGATFFDDLTKAVAEFEDAGDTKHAGQISHVDARSQLQGAARECLADVSILDTYYRAAFRSDPDALTAWNAARNVKGPFHHQPGTSSVTPVTPADPGRAATAA